MSLFASLLHPGELAKKGRRAVTLLLAFGRIFLFGGFPKKELVEYLDTELVAAGEIVPLRLWKSWSLIIAVQL